MQARELMSDNVATCTPQTSLQEVARMMLECDCGAIPVVESDGNKRVVGIVTDRDIVCRGLAQGRNPMEMTARDCMSSPVYTVTPDTSEEELARLMEEHQVRRAVVIEGEGDCCGIISQADIARNAPEHETAEVVKYVSMPSAGGGF